VCVFATLCGVFYVCVCESCVCVVCFFVFLVCVVCVFVYECLVIVSSFM